MARQVNVDILIKNGTVYTANSALPHLSNGAIAIQAGKIVGIGATDAIAEDYAACDEIDAGGAIVHPGLIDSHFHLLSAPFHTLPVSINGDEGRPISYADIKTSTNYASVRAFAKAVAVALLRKGFTCFVEPGTVFETDALAEGISEIGTRAMVAAPYAWDDVYALQAALPGVCTDQLVSMAPPDIDRVLDRTALELERNADTDARVRGFACLYGEGTASNQLFVELKALARENGVVLNLHQNAHPITVEMEVSHFGATGLLRMADHGILDPQTLLTHVSVLTETEQGEILSNGSPVIWCPFYMLREGLHLKHTVYHPQFYRQGLGVSVAIDGILAPPLGAATFAASMLAWATGQQLDPHAPFLMTSIHAARNIGLGDRLGSLEPGKRADVVVRKIGDMTQQPLDTRGVLLATSSDTIPVDIVIVDGEVVFRDGSPTKVDERMTLNEAVTERKKLLERIQL